MLGDTEAQVATTDLESEYEILGELGRGATAVVYRARDRELGREVAIKVIRPRFADDDESVARLAREARTVAQLQHPNIVTLFAVRRLRDGGLALVMQMVPGRTLRDVLNERGALTFGWADRVLRDVGAALAHAHERGIVHRDVKPENIFIDETTGRALLSDFGVARSLEPDSQLTATGTAIGTPSYMSPEQIDGTHLDGRSDLYSLGLVGWEMITGRRPWRHLQTEARRASCDRRAPRRHTRSTDLPHRRGDAQRPGRALGEREPFPRSRVYHRTARRVDAVARGAPQAPTCPRVHRRSSTR
jgi:serine/threonine protein kinase